MRISDWSSDVCSSDLVEAILRAAFRAPTSSNIQSHSVVVVREPETLARLSVVTSNQRHVARAPVFLAFCADMSRNERAMTASGDHLDDNKLEKGLITSVDAAHFRRSAERREGTVCVTR